MSMKFLCDLIASSIKFLSVRDLKIAAEAAWQFIDLAGLNSMSVKPLYFSNFLSLGAFKGLSLFPSSWCYPRFV